MRSAMLVALMLATTVAVAEPLTLDCEIGLSAAGVSYAGKKPRISLAVDYETKRIDYNGSGGATITKATDNVVEAQGFLSPDGYAAQEIASVSLNRITGRLVVITNPAPNKTAQRYDGDCTLGTKKF